jgi:hypothetical protein
MKRFYAIIAAALFVMPAVASAQAVNDSFRVITRNSPSPRTDTVFGQVSDWGGQPPVGGITANLVYVDDGLGGRLACEAIANAGDIAGNIAFISRGVCGFSVKAYWAQQAGAVGFIIHNDDRVPDTDCGETNGLVLMAGVDSAASVTIPGAFFERCLWADYGPLVEAGGVNVTMNPLLTTIEPGPITASTVHAARPNPFSTSTEFGVQLIRTQDVRVEVFNAIGQRVALLHDGPLAAGSVVHHFTLEATDLPSGVYLYRVTGEDFVETRNVVLAR